MKISGLIVGIAIILLAFAACAFLYQQKEKELQRVRALSAEIDKLSSERLFVMSKIKEAKAEKERIQKEIEKYNLKAEKIHTDTIATKQQLESLKAGLSESEKQYAHYSAMLNDLQSQESQAKKELDNVKQEYQGLISTLEKARDEKILLEEELQAYLATPKGVELKKIVVKVAPSLKGRILEVSSEYNFAIIDLGMKSQLKSGDIVGVYRNDSFIGKAVVENIYDEMSSIIVLNEWSHIKLATGDTVRRLSS